MRESEWLKRLEAVVNAKAARPNLFVSNDLNNLERVTQYTMIARQVAMDKTETNRFLQDVLQYAHYRRIAIGERIGPAVVPAAHALLMRGEDCRASGYNQKAAGWR